MLRTWYLWLIKFYDLFEFKLNLFGTGMGLTRPNFICPQDSMIEIRFKRTEVGILI